MTGYRITKRSRVQHPRTPSTHSLVFRSPGPVTFNEGGIVSELLSELLTLMGRSLIATAGRSPPSSSAALNMANGTITSSPPSPASSVGFGRRRDHRRTQRRLRRERARRSQDGRTDPVPGVGAPRHGEERHSRIPHRRPRSDVRRRLEHLPMMRKRPANLPARLQPRVIVGFDLEWVAEGRATRC